MGDATESRGGHPRGVRRRTLLTAGLVAAAGGLLWAGRDRLEPIVGGLLDEVQEGVRPPASRPRPVAVDQAELTTYRQLAGARLYYEITDQPTRLAMEPGFADRLAASFGSHWQARGWSTPARLTSYGSWIRTEGEATSWHHAGRAFDVGRVVGTNGRTLVSCRYDVWRGQTGVARRAAERAYWQLAATLHRDFAYVLTYLYDDAHHNHIHVDDAVSGDGLSSFSRGMRVQVHAVAAMPTRVGD